jgi:Domain of unknown function (DUF1905)
MNPARFAGEVLLGHKGAAVEVPFDPTERWGVAAGPLWRGRRGHRVRGDLKKVRFESSIVPRSKRFWLLLDEGLLASAKVSPGDRIRVAIEPVTSRPRAPRSSSAAARRRG